MDKWTLGADGSPIYPSKTEVSPPENVENHPGTPQKAVDFDPGIPQHGGSDCRLVLRVAPQSYEWARGLADHCSLNLTDLIWQSLMRQADASGYHTRVPTRYEPKNPGRRRRRLSVF